MGKPARRRGRYAHQDRLHRHQRQRQNRKLNEYPGGAKRAHDDQQVLVAALTKFLFLQGHAVELKPMPDKLKPQLPGNALLQRLDVGV